MIGRALALIFVTARDYLAGGLVRLGVRPNHLTLAGVVLTTAGGACYAIGASSPLAWSLDPHSPANAYLLLAGVLMLLASACDMLDGAVARIGTSGTRFGAFLDSTLDRYGDFAVYAGLAAHYAAIRPANATFVLLCMLAFFNAFMISYTRARAEALAIPGSVGYWQRGERSAAVLIGTFAYNPPAMILQQAVLPALTVLRRILHAKAVTEGRTPIVDPRQGGWWLKVRLWRWPRMTLPYDFVTGLNIAWLVFARFSAPDPLSQWV